MHDQPLLHILAAAANLWLEHANLVSVHCYSMDNGLHHHDIHAGNLAKAADVIALTAFMV